MNSTGNTRLPDSFIMVARNSRRNPRAVVVYFQYGGNALPKLRYTLKNDILFKMVFVKYPDLLKRLVAELLAIRLESIKEFVYRVPRIGQKLEQYSIT